EVPGSVSGEDAAGPVAAVGRRGQAEHEEPGLRVPEPRHRPAPVLLVGEPRRPIPGHLLAPGHEPRAPPAGDDVASNLREPANAHRSLAAFTASTGDGVARTPAARPDPPRLPRPRALGARDVAVPPRASVRGHRRAQAVPTWTRC